jgi:hypothetical protein
LGFPLNLPGTSILGRSKEKKISIAILTIYFSNHLENHSGGIPKYRISHFQMGEEEALFCIGSAAVTISSEGLKRSLLGLPIERIPPFETDICPATPARLPGLRSGG